MREGILAHVGRTPLVRLKNASPNPRVTLWAKLELCNPSGSLKDRVALHMIEQAERRGELRPGMTLVEATSGNTGIALGMAAAVKGYGLKIFMSEAKTVERRKMLRYWGAELNLTTREDPDSHIWAAKALAEAEPGRFFYINQNENPDNVEAHRLGTGTEIVEQSGGKVDAFVAGFGTGGCLMGVARAFREKGVEARIVAVEPPPSGGIDGLKHRDEAYQPLIADRSVLTDTVSVLPEEAVRAARSIAAREGILAGLSSGATLHAAQELARTMEQGNIVVLFGDRGERYFSTPLFAEG